MRGARRDEPLSLDDSSERQAVGDDDATVQPRIVGRYVLWGAIGAGGCATVHLGRLISEAGFSRTVAVKRLHSEYSADPEFVGMFLDEARLAARIHHPNVVQSLDVFWSRAPQGGRELFMIMDYVEGETLARLIAKCAARSERAPVGVVLTMMSGVLRGLHAAHEARSASGAPLELVHRDVSPQNIVVGVDGVARLLDFGIAKAIGRIHTTRQGDFKGKAAYMAPEQILGNATKLSDVYAASVVLWEALTAKRLFKGENQAAVLHQVVAMEVPQPTTSAPDLSSAIEEVVMRGLARNATARFPTALAMAEAIEKTGELASYAEVGTWVRRVAQHELQERAAQVSVIENIDPTALLALTKQSAISTVRETLAEQVTRVERAAPPLLAPAPALPRRSVLSVILVLLFLAVPGALMLSRRRTHEHRLQPLVESATASLSVPAGADSSREEDADIPSSAASAPEQLPMAPSATHTVTPRMRTPVPPSHSSRRPAPSASSECAPPFIIDSAGRMHFKTECL